MRHAIDRGFARFDFTVGDEGYKRDWSDTVLKLYDYLAAETPRGWLVVALTSAYRRTKRFIKQTPVAVATFSGCGPALRRPAPSLRPRLQASAASQCRARPCGRVRTLCYKHLRAIRARTPVSGSRSRV